MEEVSPPSNYVGTSLQISYSRLRAPKEMAQPTGAEPAFGRCAVCTAIKEGFNGDGTVVSYLNNIQTTTETTMKLTAIALAAAFVLSGTSAFAHTVRHESHVRTYPMYRDAEPSAVLHPNYGNPNGNPDGPTTLSGTGDSQFGGSSPGTSGYN
jgi:hypothetical protein